MTTLNPSAKEFVPNFAFPPPIPSIENSAVVDKNNHALGEQRATVITQDVRNLPVSDSSLVKTKNRGKLRNQEPTREFANKNKHEKKKRNNQENRKDVRSHASTINDSNSLAGLHEQEGQVNQNPPEQKKKGPRRPNRANPKIKVQPAKEKIADNKSNAIADESIENVGDEIIESKPSPYLLALKKAAAITVQQSTATPAIQDNEEAAATPKEIDIDNTKPHLTNKVVKIVSQRVIEALKPTWIQISLDLTKKEKERESAAQLEKEKNNSRTSNGKDSQYHMWNSILKPITEPVRNEEYFRSHAEQRIQKTQVSSNSMKDVSMKTVGAASERIISKAQWWTVVFTAQLELVFKYLEEGCNWEDRYEGEAVDWGECKFQIDLQSNFGMTTLHIFAKYSYFDMCFHHLLELPSVQRSVDMKDRAMKRTVFHYACEQGNLSIVQSLLKLGVEVNLRDKHGDTPLHIASSHQHVAIAQLLLDKCSRSDELKVNIRNKKGQHALMLSKSRAMTMLLLEYGSDPTVQDSEGNTAVSLAARHGEFAMLKSLLACNTFKSLDTRSKYDVLDLGFLPLSTPPTQLHPAKSISLIETSPLHQATLNRHLSCLRLLLDFPYYDINGFDKPSQCTPLMYACMLGDVNAVLLLLQKGAVTGCYTTNMLIAIELLPNAASSGLNEAALAAINGHDMLLRQVSNVLRSTSSKSKLFTSMNDKGNYALTEVANQLFLRNKQQNLDQKGTSNVMLTVDERIIIKQDILASYLSVFATLIACGTPLSKRFLDLYASEECKKLLQLYHLFEDWTPSRVALPRVDDDKQQVDNLPDPQPKSFTDYFPEWCYDTLSLQIVVSSMKMFDVLFRVKDGQIFVSQSFIWKFHSPAMFAMFDSPLCKKITFQEVVHRFPTLHRDQYVLMDENQVIYEVDFTHIDLDIMQVMEAYLHTADHTVLSSIQEPQQLVDMLYLCNELLLGRLQVLVELRIFALRSFFKEEDLKQLVSILTPQALAKLIEGETNHCDYVWSKQNSMKAFKQHQCFSKRHHSSLFDICSILKSWYVHDAKDVQDPIIHGGASSSSYLQSTENVSLRIDVSAETNGSFTAARMNVEQHHYSALCRHCQHYLSIGYRVATPVWSKTLYVHSDIKSTHRQMKLFHNQNDHVLSLNYHIPSHINVESMETMQQHCDEIGRWMNLINHVRIPLLRSNITANVLLTYNSKVNVENAASILSKLDNSLGSTVFFVHKEIIYACGDKFEAMLQFKYQTQQSDRKQSYSSEDGHGIIDVLSLPSLSSPSLYFFVQFLYLGVLPVQEFVEYPALSAHTILLELALFGCEYLIPSLYDQCSKLMMKFLQVDNASEVYEFAFRHRLRNIERIAALFLMKLMNVSQLPLSSILNVDQMQEDDEDHKEGASKEGDEPTQKHLLHQETDHFIRDFLTGLLTSIIS